MRRRYRDGVAILLLDDMFAMPKDQGAFNRLLRRWPRRDTPEFQDRLAAAVDDVGFTPAMRAALDGDFLLNKSTRLVSILRAVGDKLKSSAGQCDTPETLHALLLESRDCAKLIQRAGLVCDVDLSRAAVRCVHCADPAAFEAIDDYDTLLPAFHAAGRRDVRLAILHGMVHGSVERASVFARDELKGEERLAAAVLLLNHRDYSLNHEIDRALSRAAPLPVAMRKNVHVHLPSTAHYVAITRRGLSKMGISQAPNNILTTRHCQVPCRRLECKRYIP
jgi:hypothetical protein